MRNPQLALEYLVTCSQTSLEGFELARLSQISSFRKQFGELQDQWIEAEVAARLARLLLEHRRAESQSTSNSPALLASISVLERPSDEPAGTSTLHAGGESRELLPIPSESSPHPELPVVESSQEQQALAGCHSPGSWMLSAVPSNCAGISHALKTDRPAKRSGGGMKSSATFPPAFVPLTAPGTPSQPPAKILSSNLLLFAASGSPMSGPASREHGQTQSQQLSLFASGSEKFRASRSSESRKPQRRPICSESSVSQASHQRTAGSVPRPVPRSTRHSIPRPTLRPIHRKALGHSRRLASSA